MKILKSSRKFTKRTGGVKCIVIPNHISNKNQDVEILESIFQKLVVKYDNEKHFKPFMLVDKGLVDIYGVAVFTGEFKESCLNESFVYKISVYIKRGDFKRSKLSVEKVIKYLNKGVKNNGKK